jgi:hypothetical protein
LPSSEIFEGIEIEDVSPPPLPPSKPVYDISHLPHDPGERLPIASYHVND